MWTWLLSCAAEEGSGQPQPETVSWYADADGDGWGAGPASLAAVAPPGFVGRDGDCDDTRPSVHPGAESICDDVVDDNCDGQVDLLDADGDGDGLTACQGDCDDGDPSRPTDIEYCNGVDDDCDGLVDMADPDRDPWTCGDCMVADDYPGTATYAEVTLNPCLLDPPATMYCLDDPDDPDTHGNGRRLHRVKWRTDVALRDPLLLMMMSGDGEDINALREWGAFAGYRVLQLGYASSAGVVPDCAGEGGACSEPARAEIVYGIDGTDAYEVSWEDSIVGRLDTVLLALEGGQPGMGWASYRTGPGTFDWSRIVVMGWSEGSAFAHFLAGDFYTYAALTVSGPLEVVQETGLPIDWILAPMATPTCARWGFAHAFEQEIMDISLAWELTGLQPVPPLEIEASAPPYDGAHALVTSSMDVESYPDCGGHLAMAKDHCVHADAVLPAWLHLFCEMGRPETRDCVD
jgi:hypothetical protein